MLQTSRLGCYSVISQHYEAARLEGRMLVVSAAMYTYNRSVDRDAACVAFEKSAWSFAFSYQQLSAVPPLLA